MAYPDSRLHPGEEVLRYCHPHWRTQVRPAFLLLTGAASFGLVLGFLDRRGMYVQVTEVELAIILGCALIAAFVFWRGVARPIVGRLATHLVITDRRLMYREGIFRKREINIPFGHVVDVRYRRTLCERALRTGSLIVFLPGVPPAEFDRVPRVDVIHALVYDRLSFSRNLQNQ